MDSEASEAICFEFDDDELSPVEYARRYNLVSSHLQENPFRAIKASLSHDLVLPGFEDPRSTLDIDEVIDMDSVNERVVHEKWEVDRDTAAFLASVLSFEKADDLIDIQRSDGPLLVRDLKIEEAILASDPQVDLWQLKRRNSVKLSSTGMLLWTQNEENDDFEWSIEEAEAAMEDGRPVQDEKLAVVPETVEYLKTVSLPPLLTIEDIVDADLDRAKSSRSLFCSPPLLPCSPPLQSKMLSTSVGDFELTSTPEDIDTMQLPKIEAVLFGQDEVLSMETSFTSSYAENSSAALKCASTLMCTPDNSSSSPRAKRGFQDFEVDVPLMPLSLMDSPTKRAKKVSFVAQLATMIPDADCETRSNTSEQDVQNIFRDVVRPSAAPALHEVENESLSEFDTTMRVAVPHIDEKGPTLSWQNLRNLDTKIDMRASTMLLAKSSLTGSEAKWSGVSKLERVLSRKPFPESLGEAQLDETFDDGSLTRYLAEMNFGDRIEMEDLLWNPEGFKVLDGSDSEDEDLDILDVNEEEEVFADQPLLRNASLSRAVHPEVASLLSKVVSKRAENDQTDMQTLLKRRKLALERDASSERLQEASLQSVARDANLASESFVVDLNNADGLSNFMQLHGVAQQKTRRAQEPEIPISRNVAPLPVMVASQQTEKEQTNKMRPHVAAPEVISFEEPISIVLSSDLNPRHHLVRKIQALLPTIDMIERSHIAAPEDRELGNQGACNSSEADITISAGVGVIFTTLQKLKQKPLPGQSNFFGIRDRIQHVAVRYERLIILVSTGHQMLDSVSQDIGRLDESDSVTMSELIAFGALLDTDLEAYYVGVGDYEVAQWTAALVSRYSSSRGDVNLLQDETLWERLLRHVGLNAFAAQGILSQLKMPETPSSLEHSSLANVATSATPYGLAAFVQMSAQQRIQRFAPLMGGHRVLERVNKAIDRQWVSVDIPG